MRKNFMIGDFYFTIEFPDQLIIPTHFMTFNKTENEKNIEHTFKIELVSRLPQFNGILLATREDLLVKSENACTKEVDEQNTHIYLDINKIKDLNIDPVFTSLFSLEKHMLKRQQLVLHCSYIEYENEAILFTAPSETGKTTQANLWEKYKDSHTINGDKALLKFEKGRWIAQGWPVCGTSEICYNKNYPVKAIVVLSQGKENTIQIKNMAESFKKTYSQITINRWNEMLHTEAINLISKLISDVDIYHLSCTISKEAVDCLYNKIYDDQY